MKPPNDLQHKGIEVEEWVDLKFFRPIGIRIARALQPTEVSADQVTLWAILIGVVAGHLFLYRDPWVNAMGFLLFVVSDVFDSADGQLARLRGTSSRLGRTLDGLGDHVRFLSLYIHLGLRMALAGWHWQGFALSMIAMLSHATQSMGVDFVRSAYLALGTAAKGAVDLPEDLPAHQEGSLLERFAAWTYINYIRQQARLFPHTVDLARSLRRLDATPAFRAQYRERQQPLLPICAWLGQNIRFALLGLAGVAGYPSAYLWTEVLAMNFVLFVILVPAYEANSSALVSSLGGEARAY